MALPLVVAALIAAVPAAAEDEIAVGVPAPAFSLRTMNPAAAGTAWVALDRYVGEEPEDAGAKVVLLSFFASWCEPCKKELPFLVQLDRMYRDEGLRVVGICIDKEEAGIAVARKLVDDGDVSYPVLSDRFNFLARRYLGEKAPLPSVFVIRRDGVIARIERGYTRHASAFLLAEVQAALGLKKQAAVSKGAPGKGAK